jgi:hypothetical protein
MALSTIPIADPYAWALGSCRRRGLRCAGTRMRGLHQGYPSVGPNPSMLTLDNGLIKIGLDPQQGGQTYYLGLSPSHPNYASYPGNLENANGRGAGMGVTPYSGPVPYNDPVTGAAPAPNAQWMWNPVKQGDNGVWYGRIQGYGSDGATLYSVAHGHQWMLNNILEQYCLFEATVHLLPGLPVAQVTELLTLSRPDLTFYGYWQQENYCYTNGGQAVGQELAYLWYENEAGTLTQNHYYGPPPWAHFFSQGWAAHVTLPGVVAGFPNGFGAGVITPGTCAFTGGFNSGDPLNPIKPGGPTAFPNGYKAGLWGATHLDHNIVYGKSYYLAVGDLVNDIQSFARSIRSSVPPSYNFIADRQDFRYVNALDSGWPIQGYLHVTLTRNDPQLWSPVGYWATSQAPFLYVKLRYNVTGPDTLTLFPQTGFNTASGFGTTDATIKSQVPIIPDGQWHVYKLPMPANAPPNIYGVRLDLIGSGLTNPGTVDVAWIVPGAAAPSYGVGASMAREPFRRNYSSEVWRSICALEKYRVNQARVV